MNIRRLQDRDGLSQKNLITCGGYGIAADGTDRSVSQGMKEGEGQVREIARPPESTTPIPQLSHGPLTTWKFHKNSEYQTPPFSIFQAPNLVAVAAMIVTVVVAIAVTVKKTAP